MKKNVVLINFLLLASLNIIFANEAIARTNYNKIPRNNAKQIKLGPQIGSGLTSHQIGLFGEYGLDEKLGLQINIFYQRYVYFMSSIEVSEGGSAITEANYISLPVLLRFYPGNDRQFCWFGGIQLGYLVTGKFKFRDDEELDFLKDFKNIVDDFQQAPFVNLKELSEQDKINKLQLAIVAGFDYEFEFGLILGISYSKGLIEVIKCKESHSHWTLQLTLGYNLAKFFNF